MPPISAGASDVPEMDSQKIRPRCSQGRRHDDIGPGRRADVRVVMTMEHRDPGALPRKSGQNPNSSKHMEARTPRWNVMVVQRAITAKVYVEGESSIFGLESKESRSGPKSAASGVHDSKVASLRS